MAKKTNADPIDRATSNAERRMKRKAKGKWRRLHAATKAIVIFCALAGIAAGALFGMRMSRNDRFLLLGESHYTVELGSEYLYAEEGVEAVCFGRDVSGKLSVQTSLQKNAEGKYVIPTDKEGVYTIVYTVDCIKFGENAPNGAIRRIRTFTVIATEEDGIYEQ